MDPNYRPGPAPIVDHQPRPRVPHRRPAMQYGLNRQARRALGITAVRSKDDEFAVSMVRFQQPANSRGNQDRRRRRARRGLSHAIGHERQKGRVR